MKQFYLTVVFTVYHLFMPFVVLNCATSDLPYVVQAESAAEDTDAQLAECEAQEFLTEDCVSLMQAEAERLAELEEAIATAYDDLSEFMTCQSMTITSETDNDTATDSAASDCTAIIAAMQDGYDACLATSEEEQGFTCDQIILSVSTAEDLCLAGDASVTTDFCGELS